MRHPSNNNKLICSNKTEVILFQVSPWVSPVGVISLLTKLGFTAKLLLDLPLRPQQRHIHSSYSTFQTLLDIFGIKIWGFLGLNKSPQPINCTRKIFWLKKVAEKSYSLKHCWWRLLSIQYIFQRESRCSKKGIKIPCNRDFCGWWVKQWPI